MFSSLNIEEKKLSSNKRNFCLLNFRSHLNVHVIFNLNFELKNLLHHFIFMHMCSILKVEILIVLKNYVLTSANIKSIWSHTQLTITIKN